MAWKYKGGLILLLAVVIIWVTSAEITQSIFTDYEHPFVVTYIGTSMLIAYLAIAFIKDCIVKFMRSYFLKRSESKKVPDFVQSLSMDSSILNESKSKVDDGNSSSSSSNISEIQHHEQSLAKDEECVVHVPYSQEGQPAQIVVSVGHCECRVPDVVVLKTEERKFNTKEIAILALTIGPIWFVSEYFTNAALARTSVATTTILFSTSGLFTLIIDGFMERQSLTIVNIVSVVVSMAGVALTTVGKTWARDEAQSSSSKHGKHSIVGDIFALLSAFTDGLYYVILKKYAGEEGEKVDMQKFLGYVGLFTLTTLWWLIWPLRAMGIEARFAIPQTAKVAEVVLANCFIGNFVSDYFWAMGVVWTSPLVAALGASLTIPLAMLGDMVIHGRHYSVVYILGSIQVFLDLELLTFLIGYHQS